MSKRFVKRCSKKNNRYQVMYKCDNCDGRRQRAFKRKMVSHPPVGEQPTYDL